jgi:hypothetical protein
LLLGILNFRKGTLSSELRQLGKALCGQDALTPVTNSAFCQARMKLRPEVLTNLNKALIKTFGEHFELRGWQGFRVLATDGSTARLPKDEDLQEYYGGPSDASCPMAQLSQLFDVLNKTVIHAEIAPYDTSERELAANHLYWTQEKDLLLYDRGYAAFWLFSMHRDLDRDYCARVKLDFSAQVKAFVESGKRTELIQMEPSAEAKRQCEEYNLSSAPIPVRLVRVELENGEVEVLVTSLLDTKQYPTRLFAKLYALRWGVEESYKRLKVRMEVENFSCKTVWTIRQDFYAKMVAVNLAAIMEWVAQAIADRLYKDRKLSYQINFANALSVLKNDLIRWIALGRPMEMLLRLLTEIVAEVEPVRPGRSFPRNKKRSSVTEFHFNRKRCS